MINVYGIYSKSDNTCLYIGSTTRDVGIRFKEHQRDLRLHKHDNKSLQKAYDTYNANAVNEWEYRLLDSINADSSMLLFFYECLYNSYYRPRCCRCYIQQGRSGISLARLDSVHAEQIIESIQNIYSNGDSCDT